MGKTFLLLGLELLFCLTAVGDAAADVLKPAADYPLAADSYGDQQIPLFGRLIGRVQREPLNPVATIIFFCDHSHVSDRSVS